MVKRLVVLLVLAVFAFGLTGCATTKSKQSELEMQGLRNQISALESQVQSRDAQISSLSEALDEANRQNVGTAQSMPAGKKCVGEMKRKPRIKQVQAALKNAGYDPGPIDGKLGKQTREAIKAFQKANNLQVDGKVGKKTWEVLKPYLETRVK
ncbi:MAG: peptidoglycan-binding protein [Candidatus Omnitrophica bacterium]|nr:peptidoglycan-binding protein [Candidatus Omnitrophota bacterium]